MGRTEPAVAEVVAKDAGDPSPSLTPLRGHRGSRRLLLGLPVDAVSMDQVVARAALAIGQRQPLRIVVTNANKAWLAARDPQVRDVLERSDLVVAEWATAWAAGVLGCRGVEHIGGITLMIRLLAEAAERGWRCYFLGARPEVTEVLIRRLRSERPRLRIAGWHHGYLDGPASERVRQQLERCRPDLLFVAMGSPLQERWIMELPSSCAGVRLGVGGSFDVLAGLRRDAPGWARGRGLEWLWRLAQNPRRLWKRYLVTNTWFVGRVIQARLRRSADLPGRRTPNSRAEASPPTNLPRAQG